MALTTKIEGLEARLKQNTTVLATSGGGSVGTNAVSGLDRNIIPGTYIELWRVTKKGTSITIDGKTYWGCEKHVDPAGRLYGMYAMHKPEDHSAVVARRRTKRKKRRQDPDNKNNKPAGGNLVISQRLKEVLCSKFMVSDADADAICNDICSQPKECARNMGCMVK